MLTGRKCYRFIEFQNKNKLMLRIFLQPQARLNILTSLSRKYLNAPIYCKNIYTYKLISS